MYYMYELCLNYVPSMSNICILCNHVNYGYIIHKIVCTSHNGHNTHNTHNTHNDIIQTKELHNINHEVHENLDVR